MKAETHAVLAEDLLERSRTGLAVALKGELPLEEQAHGAQVAIAMATAAQVHATLAAVPAEVAAVNEALAKATADNATIIHILACLLREALVNEDPKIRFWARGITEELRREGQNITRELTAVAEARGIGPDLFDLDGVRYDLHQQYVDAKGKRWEHTGGWTDTEKPLMGRDDTQGKVTTLPELVRARGPLMKLTDARRDRSPMQTPWGSTAPF